MSFWYCEPTIRQRWTSPGRMAMVGWRWPLTEKKRVAVSLNRSAKFSTIPRSSNTTSASSINRSFAFVISGTPAKSPSTMIAPIRPLAIWMSALPWWCGWYQ